MTLASPRHFLSTAVVEMIRRRAATDHFDPTHVLGDDEIVQLAELAFRAPSAFNLQNWHLHAVRTPLMKARLRAAAFGQAKVEEAAVTFVVSGELPSGKEVASRLAPSVATGIMDSSVAEAWATQANTSYRDEQRARDEAIRSATLLASTLMFAAEGQGLNTAPMSGFNPEAVRGLLELPIELLPIMLVAIGLPFSKARRQKIRRPQGEVLSLV